MNTNEQKKITILKIVNFILISLIFIGIFKNYGLENYILDTFGFYDHYEYLYIIIVPKIILLLNIIFFFKQKNQLKKQKCLFWISITFAPINFLYFSLVWLFC